MCSPTMMDESSQKNANVAEHFHFLQRSDVVHLHMDEWLTGLEVG